MVLHRAVKITVFFLVRPVVAGLVIRVYYSPQPTATPLWLLDSANLAQVSGALILLFKHPRWGGGVGLSVSAVQFLQSGTDGPPHPRSVGSSLVPSGPTSPVLLLSFSLLHQVAFCSPAVVLITPFSTAAPPHPLVRQ